MAGVKAADAIRFQGEVLTGGEFDPEAEGNGGGKDLSGLNVGGRFSYLHIIDEPNALEVNGIRFSIEGFTDVVEMHQYKFGLSGGFQSNLPFFTYGGDLGLQLRNEQVKDGGDADFSFGGFAQAYIGLPLNTVAFYARLSSHPWSDRELVPSFYGGVNILGIIREFVE